jgi:hypothetical protein
MGLLLAYGGLYLPGGGNLQPYRYIDQAMIWSVVGLGTGLRTLWATSNDNSGQKRRPTLRRALFLLAAVLVILWVRETVILYRPFRWDGNRCNRWQGPSAEVKAICDYLQTSSPPNGRLLVDDPRIGTLLPWCSGVEVIGGPFFFTWTDYGHTNANMWTFLETPYQDYNPQSWQQALRDYNVEWLIVNTNWGVAEWFTMSDWLALYPEAVEAGPQFGLYQFYKVNGYEPDSRLAITADHGSLQIQNATLGQPIRLPYHWIPTLEVWPPNSAQIQTEMVGSDPIPFIVVVPAQASFLICDPTGCPER